MQLFVKPILLQGPAAVIALKLLETNPGEQDGYMCAFLQSPVNDLSHYRKSNSVSLFVGPLSLLDLDAVYTERISGFTGDMFSSRRLRIGNRSLAIVHGTADGKELIFAQGEQNYHSILAEVVHFKHAATLAKSLVETSINFDFKVNPLVC